MPDIVIFSPDYTYLHSGVRCLHLLCDRMNQLGVSAAVTSRVIDSRLQTPQVDPTELAAKPSILDRSILIYPEVVAGNPLGARNVVRYLLNRPGFLSSSGLESYGTSDYFIHFAEEFRPSGLKSRRLRLPLVDRSTFKPPSPSCERNGFLVYSHRYQPNSGTFPDWVDSLTVISREAPRDPPMLADLYRSSRALIVGERTAAIAEALHCHCPVIMLPHVDFAYEPLVAFFGARGLTLGFDRAALTRATESAPAFPAHYAAQYVDADRQILEFVADAKHYFGLTRAWKNWFGLTRAWKN